MKPVSCATIVFLLFIASCSTVDAPQLHTQSEFVRGQPPSLSASGLKPDSVYTIEAERTDALGRLWTSSATFKADAGGYIDIARDQPTGGSYEGVDPYGLIWSMTMPTPPDENWTPPEPELFNQYEFTLREGDRLLSQASSRQWIVAPGIKSEKIPGPLVAELFLPADPSEPTPALLLLGGSGGGMAWAQRWAAVWASEGYAAMALAYFKADGLPEHLAQIPLEYVYDALETLKARPEVDPGRVGIMGYSKGAELALLVASRRADLNVLVAIAPGSAVFAGFKPPKYPVLSSWTEQGEDISFVPNAYDKKFFETFDGMYLWYRTLAQHELVQTAAIPVDRIECNLLLLSGIDDQIWPATYMGEQIMARLHVAEFPYEHKHLAFPEAGHGLAEPSGGPTTGVSKRLGGTPQGNARARELGWRAIRDFVARSLGS